MPNVKIYTTPTCPWCKKTKEFLKENNVEYEEADVSSDQEAQKEMIDKSGQMGVPVLDIDGEIIVGYDVDKMKKVLKLEG
jgi:glutaredoxin-like YruB-family protein